MLSFSRALYSRASYLLIDDALSALDAVSGHHVLTQALTGPLVKDRCVILITHNVKLCLSAGAPAMILDVKDGLVSVRNHNEGKNHLLEEEEKTAAQSPMDTETPAGLVEEAQPTHKFLSEEQRQTGNGTFLLVTMHILLKNVGHQLNGRYTRHMSQPLAISSGLYCSLWYF